MTAKRSSQSNSSPTLSDVTAVGRDVLKYGVILLVSYMVLKVLIGSLVNYWRATHPEPPPPPTVGFGKLPSLEFPQEYEKARPDSYKLETAKGRFPSFPDRAKVYLMPAFSPNLLADGEVRAIARSSGFLGQPVLLDSLNYRWLLNEPLETFFEINLKSYNFSLTTDYLSRPELVGDLLSVDESSAISAVKIYLSRVNLLPSDMATSSAKVNYLKALGGELFEAVSLSDADFLQVDLDRIPVDGQYEMYTPNGEEGIVSAIISGAVENGSQIVELHNRYQPVNYNSVETYPLQSVSNAWKELQEGGGYIASPKNKLSEAVVRGVVLGYFDDFSEQHYLLPIYVFRGDDDFIGYVSAISSAYFQE